MSLSCEDLFNNHPLKYNFKWVNGFAEMVLLRLDMEMSKNNNYDFRSHKRSCVYTEGRHTSPNHLGLFAIRYSHYTRIIFLQPLKDHKKDKSTEQVEFVPTIVYKYGYF
ncbi:hypothetical protein NPIL_13711 [Nephila pilipes]|uniref:Uncharacterized protein n=1 Tax=Nephila pilipes TaxID=299642 RepID=A0A8X6NB55_NEPPI|nr:hypothetical protein NPIL_13711 [Nephila pilipes]